MPRLLAHSNNEFIPIGSRSAAITDSHVHVAYSSSRAIGKHWRVSSIPAWGKRITMRCGQGCTLPCVLKSHHERGCWHIKMICNRASFCRSLLCQGLHAKRRASCMSRVNYLANGVGRGVLSLEGGKIGMVILGWSPVKVFKKATIFAFSSLEKFLPS